MSNSHLFLKSAFPRAPFGLGIGRYVPQLQRVTLKFCKSFGASHGMRKFVEQDLVDFAQNNPGVVVYVKPRRHRGPVIVAEYLNGERQWVNCHEYTREDIVKWMDMLLKQNQDGGAVRLRKLWHTEFPSIQGPWTPFTFRKPARNVTEFPNAIIGAAMKKYPTATEKVITLFKKQQELKAEEDRANRHESVS